MREIKFRGKRKHGAGMLIGDLVRTCNGGPCIFPSNDSLGLNSPDYYEVDPETIGQFTGLLDRDKKEIFEGDIMGPCLVKFAKGRFNLYYDFGNAEEMEDDFQSYARNWVVRGNIYEHKHLLE